MHEVVDTQEQLSLFTLFEKNRLSAGFSYLMGIYDAIPKYRYSAQNAKRIEDTQYHRELTIDGVDLQITIKAAMVKNASGENIAFFAGEREEILDEVIRKLASQGCSIFMDGRVGVSFTIADICAELKSKNRSYNNRQIYEGLEVLRNTTILCTNKSGNFSFETNMLDSCVFAAKTQNGRRKESCIVVLNSFVQKTIFSAEYRLYDYDLCVSLKNNLARYIYRRMCMYWTQADNKNFYSFKLNTFFPQSAYERIGDNMRAVIAALDELKERCAICEYKVEIIRKSEKLNSPIEDVKFILFASEKHIEHTKLANGLKKKIRAKLSVIENEKQEDKQKKLI